MRRVTGWMAALMVLATAPAWAQESQGDLKRQLDELRKEVEALKSEKVQESKPLETPATAPKGGSAELMAGQQAAPNPLTTLFKETKISGFVDVGYVWNPNQPDSQTNAFRAFDTRANSFILHNAQINLTRAATKEMWAGFKVEIGVGSDADGFDAGYTGDVDSILVQEAHIELLIPQVEGLTVRAGRMATLAGYEVFESHLNNQYSRAMLFNFAIPFIHNGVRAEYVTMENKVKVSLGVVNGWDNQLDNNNAKTLEAQLFVAPTNFLTGAVTIYHGAEQADEDGPKRTLIDVVATATIEQFSFGINLDWGKEAYDDGDEPHNNKDHAKWNGYAFYAKYQATDMVAVSGRFERMRDEEASRFVAPPAGIHTAIWEFTLTLEVKPTDYLIFRIEYRRDESNDEVFERGTHATDKQHTVGFEAIVLF